MLVALFRDKNRAMSLPKKHVFVCVQNRPAGNQRGSCQSKGSPRVYQAFVNEFDRRELWSELRLTTSGCLGPCDEGASVVVYPDGVLYSHVGEADVSSIIDQHLLGNAPVGRLAKAVW
jgi:(2Fe-2S) ferredoxin